MENGYDHIPFYESLNPDEKAILAKEMAQNPEMKTAFGNWRAFSREIQARLDTHVPDREVLVLYALAQEDASLLTDEEQALVTAFTPAIEKAKADYPALSQIVAHIQQQHQGFEDIWQEETQHSSAPSPLRLVKSATESTSGYNASNTDAPKIRTLSYYTMRIAAAVAVVGLAAWFAFSRMNPTPVDENLVAIATHAGETRVVTLPDGSTVRLNENSQLSYNKQKSRIVELEGKGFFDVVKNPSAPFSVRTSNATTQVLGTSFAVEAPENNTVVTLVYGKVALTSHQQNHRTVILNAGEQSQVQGINEQPSAPHKVDLTQQLAWSGQFFFRETRLQDIAQQLGAYYKVQIDVPANLQDERVEGTFAFNQSVVQILHDVAASVGAKVRPSASNVYSIQKSN
jgi:ferric-dicitrate binding protein FerR (iron transport regulator)